MDNTININIDIYEIIFEKILLTDSLYDLLTFRILNKDTNDIFMNYLNNVNTDVIPRKMFINTEYCMCCDKKTIITDRRVLIYNYDRIPHKCILYCSKINCKFEALKRYMINCKINKIHLAYNIIDKQKIIDYINKTFTDYIFKDFKNETLRCYNNTYYLKCDLYYIIDYEVMYNYIEKYIRLDQKLNKYIVVYPFFKNLK